MSSINRERIRFGPAPWPLSEETAKAVDEFRADLIMRGIVFVEIAGPTQWTLTIPTDQPVTIPRTPVVAILEK